MDFALTEREEELSDAFARFFQHESSIATVANFLALPEPIADLPGRFGRRMRSRGTIAPCVDLHARALASRTDRTPGPVDAQ